MVNIRECYCTTIFYTLGLELSEPLNTAIEEFIDVALKTYVIDWYETEISDDAAFLDEIRYHLRYLGARLFRLLVSFDLPHLLLAKFSPVAVLHVLLYKTVHESVPDAKDDQLEQLVLNSFRSVGLHRAIHSRSDELDYLRDLSTLLLARLVDRDRMNSTDDHHVDHLLRELLVFCFLMPLLDLLADPDSINRLLTLLFDPESMLVNPDIVNKVPFLVGLVDSHPTTCSTSLLSLTLSDILDHPRWLMLFTDYLRRPDGAVNLLEFVASSREIGRRLGGKSVVENDDDFDGTMAHVRWLTWELYGDYVHENAQYRVQLDDHLVQEFKSIVESKDEDGQFSERLRDIVDKTCQVVYHRLQIDYVIPFCRSELYLSELLGHRPVANTKGWSKRRADIVQIDDGFSFSKFRTRFMNIFLPPSVEGYLSMVDFERKPLRNRLTSVEWAKDAETALYSAPSARIPPSHLERHRSNPEFLTAKQQQQQQQQQQSSESDSDDGLSDGELEFDENQPRDLTRWRVKIPRIEPRLETISGRTLYVYVLSLECPDSDDSRCWSIDRRYEDFFVLKSKLLEFHGGSILPQSLPSKKTFVNKDRAFLEKLRPNFEAFLQRLCRKNALRSSDLLFVFLTSKRPLQRGDTTILADFNPWKAMKKVPAKFSRERGQNLGPYLAFLSADVLAKKETNTFIVENNGDMDSVNSKKEKEEGLFGDNYGSKHEQFEEKRATTTTAFDGPSLCGTYDLLLFVFVKLMSISHPLLVCLMSIRPFLRDLFDHYVHFFLRQLLLLSLHDLNLVRLVHLLKDVVFYHPSVRSSLEEKLTNRRSARRMTIQFLTRHLPCWFGIDRLHGGIDLTLECLQHPRLNKQLSYTLLDLLVYELFPDLRQ